MTLIWDTTSIPKFVFHILYFCTYLLFFIFADFFCTLAIFFALFLFILCTYVYTCLYDYYKIYIDTLTILLLFHSLSLFFVYSFLFWYRGMKNGLYNHEESSLIGLVFFFIFILYLLICVEYVVYMCIYCE